LKEKEKKGAGEPRASSPRFVPAPSLALVEKERLRKGAGSLPENTS
jgi:hypothetical protein